MILWTIKQLNSIRLAIAGRQHPSQLAWGVAFGLLLGVVPHGNLLAVLLVLLVLSLKLNHAIAGLTAVGVTFAAGYLDPWSDEIGRRLLTHPDSRRWAELAWEYPLVPWTDLNNTVVLGSFSIGTAMLVPTFCICYPVFRRLSPAGRLRSANREAPESAAEGVPAEGVSAEGVSAEGVSAKAGSVGGVSVDGGSGEGSGATVPATGPPDVRRVASSDGDAISDGPRMEESLRFLLHQLRDSKPKDAA